MKNLIIPLVLLISLISCNSSNPTQNEENPFADSTNIKFIYEFKSYEAWGEGQDVGNTFVLFNNGDYKYYSDICGKRQHEYIYKIVYQGNKTKKFKDSLDNIFINANFQNYSNELPYDTDSTSRFYMPSYNETISWRPNEYNKFKKVHIRKKPVKGKYKFPMGYEEFRKDLYNHLKIINR